MSATPLALAVFGMGLGESILLRFETDGEVRWAVVDSARKKLKDGSVNPALEVLRSAGAHPSLVVLTHPHRDHSKGMADLVRRAAPGARVGCVEPLMEDKDELTAMVLNDDRLANDIGQATLAHAAIFTAWREGRAQRLAVETEAQRFDFCGWEVAVLHPPRALTKQASDDVRQGGNPNLNDISAALSVTRGQVTFLLAGDGERATWENVEAHIDPGHLRGAHPLKVPHHGSLPALHPVMVDPTRPEAREQAVTPFPMSGTLPRLDPHGGAERLIDAGGSLRLTAMPVAALPKEQSVTLAEARAALQPSAFAGDDAEIQTIALRPNETPRFDEGERDPRECWVLLGVAPDGTVAAELGTHAVSLS